MPLTKKGKKIMRAMRAQYGSKKGKKVFYASKNKGTIKGVEDETQMNWQNKLYESLTEAGRTGAGHQFSPQKTKSGMKVSRFHDPRAQQARAAAAATAAEKDPEGVDPESGVPRRRITARAPRRYRFKRYSR